MAELFQKVLPIFSPAYAIVTHFFPPPEEAEGITPPVPPSAKYPSPDDKDAVTQFYLFSPYVSAEDPFLETMILALVGVKLMKTPEGLKVLRDLGVEYMKTVGKIVGELESSSSSNWMTALINQKLCLRVCRRLGLISTVEAATLDSSYNWIYDRNSLITGIADTFTGLGTFAKGVGAIMGAT